MTVEAHKGYRDMMVGTISGRRPEQLAAWMNCKAYIAVGVGLSAAAHAGIDAGPMEGFDPALVDGDLGLTGQNLTSAVLMPVGFRAADDATSAYKKVRYSQDQFFVWKK